MTKRAFLVLGAESSGVQVVANLLRSAGCKGYISPDGFYQQWDSTPPTTQNPIVWQRTFPHNNDFMPVKQIIRQIPDYEVQAIVCIRDWFAMSKSQSEFREGGDIHANLNRAYVMIFEGLDEFLVPYVVVSYEALVYNYRPFAESLLCHLELPVDFTFPSVFNANAKHYDLSFG